MGPGEMNSVRGYRPHCWWEIYEIGGQSHLGKVPKWLKTLGPKADRVWAALEGVDPAILRELFTERDRLYAMVSDLGRYYRGERNCARICYQESEEGRAQGRSERPRQKSRNAWRRRPENGARLSGGSRRLAKTVLKTAGPEAGAAACPPSAASSPAASPTAATPTARRAESITPFGPPVQSTASTN